MSAARPNESDERAVGKAGFLSGLLAFVFLITLSIVGLGHARTIEGAANAQYWIVVALAAGGLAWTTLMLARSPARTNAGETARKIGVVLGTLWLILFVWETIAVGTNAFSGPIELGWAAWKG